MPTPKYQMVIAQIDDINRQDPNMSYLEDEALPKELLYSQRMSECLASHWPESDEQLRIAVHGQHVKRWHLKRSDFDEGRAGYMLWRKELGIMHGEIIRTLMVNNGYSEDEANQTASILRKEKLKSNPLTQTLEDVACIVFLQFYFEEFSHKHDEEKLISILQKTWKKMSAYAHDIALNLSFPPHLQTLISKALS